MEEEVEKKEVTVETPDDTEETAGEVVEQPAGQPAATEGEKSSTTTGSGKGMNYNLNPWNETHWNSTTKKPSSTGEKDAKPAGVPVPDVAVGTTGKVNREPDAIKDGQSGTPENITSAKQDGEVQTLNGDVEGEEGKKGIIHPDKEMFGPTLNNPNLKPGDEFVSPNGLNWTVATNEPTKTGEGDEKGDVGEAKSATDELEDDAKGVTKEPENQGGEQLTEAGSKENAEGEEGETEAGSKENAEKAAKEIQGIDPNEIPTDYQSFEEWVQSKPELENFFQFMIDDSDAKLKASQKKQRREQMGVALGNLMRAFANLGTTMHGGLNSYNHESADKIRKEAGEQEEKWRTELEKNRKDRWEQYQKLREQYFKENADRRAASKEVREERKELFNEEQKRYDRKLTEAKDRRDEQMFQARLAGILTDNEIKKINEEYAEEKNRLDNEHKKILNRLEEERIVTEQSKQTKNYASAKKSEDDAVSNRIRANSSAEGKKEDETPSSVGGGDTKEKIKGLNPM